MSAATFELPRKQARRLIDGIAAETGQSTVALLNNVMELWAKDLVRQTYPRNAKAGRDRVAKDIRKVFGNERTFDDESIRMAFKKKREFDIENPHLLFRPRMTASDMQSIHEGHRDRRGRVSRRTNTGLIVSETALRKYIRQRQQGVGKLKAGWAAVAARYRVAMPAFVSRHGQRQSGFFSDLNPKTLAGALIAENRVPYAEQKLGGRFMDFLQSKRIKDLTSGHYAKRWQKRVEKSVDKARAQ